MNNNDFESNKENSNNRKSSNTTPQLSQNVEQMNTLNHDEYPFFSDQNSIQSMISDIVTNNKDHHSLLQGIERIGSLSDQLCCSSQQQQIREKFMFSEGKNENLDSQSMSNKEKQNYSPEVKQTIEQQRKQYIQRQIQQNQDIQIENQIEQLICSSQSHSEIYQTPQFQFRTDLNELEKSNYQVLSSDSETLEEEENEQLNKESSNIQQIEIKSNKQNSCQNQEQITSIQKTLQCNICLEEGNYVVISLKQLISDYILIYKQQILIKCDLCSLQVCRKCLKKCEELDSGGDCFQRCGRKLSIASKYNEVKYKDFSIQPQTMNDLLRQSIQNEYESLDLKTQFRTDEQLVYEIVDTSITKKLKYGIYNMPIVVDLVTKTAEFQLKFPGYSEDKSNTIKYDLEINVENIQESEKNAIEKQIQDYIRNQMIKLFNVYSKKQGISMNQETLHKLNALLEENSKHRIKKQDQVLKYMKFTGTVIYSERENIYQTKINIFQQGMLQQYAHMVQYFLDIDNTQIYGKIANNYQDNEESSEIEQTINNIQEQSEEEKEEIYETSQKRRKINENEEYQPETTQYQIYRTNYELRTQRRKFEVNFRLIRSCESFDQLMQQQSQLIGNQTVNKEYGFQKLNPVICVNVVPN